MSKNIFTAIEIGEKNIKVVVANYAFGQLSVCAANTVKTQGISNGEIVSRKDVLQSLELAIGPIKEQGFDVSQALLVLPSSRMKIYRKRSTIEIVSPDRKVSARDIRELKQTFQRSTIPLDEMIVNIIPIHYLLDDQLIPGNNPINMTASKVQFDASVVTLPKVIARGYVDLIQDLGIEVLDAIVSTYALYSIIPTQKQKEHGCVIVDIGGRNTVITDIAHNQVIRTERFNFGGQYVTNSIAKEFGVTLEVAEMLKKKFATLESSYGEDIILYRDDLLHVEVSERNLENALQKCCSEFCFELNNLIARWSIDTNNVPVILVGGGANLKGFEQKFATLGNKNVFKYLSPYVGARGLEYLSCLGIIKRHVEESSR